MASINQASANAKYNEKPANWNNNIEANTPGKKNNAALTDLKQFIEAGILRDKKAPFVSQDKADIKQFLRIIDEQDAVTRYVWYNLPANLSSQELERMLYYKGQLAFFYLPDADEFYFMPYALDGGIDFYGRYNSIHPIPFAEGTGDDVDKKRVAQQRNYLSTLKLKCQYDVIDDEELNIETQLGSAVLLHDYTKQLSQLITPRRALQECILDKMADCIPFMRTAMLNATGIQGMRVQNESEQSNVTSANALIDRAALNSEKYVAIVGAIDFQDLTGGEVAKSEEFLLAMQALDNLRLSAYGIDNGGIFEKKAHTLESEQAMNTGTSGLVYQDGLSIRQHFCDIVNSIWDLGIWCEPSENAIQMDMSGDGMAMDMEDQSGTMEGQQPEGAVTTNEI